MKPKISIVCLCLMSVFLIGSLAYPAELPGRVLGINGRVRHPDCRGKGCT